MRGRKRTRKIGYRQPQTQRHLSPRRGGIEVANPHSLRLGGKELRRARTCELAWGRERGWKSVKKKCGSDKKAGGGKDEVRHRNPTKQVQTFLKKREGKGETSGGGYQDSRDRTTKKRSSPSGGKRTGKTKENQKKGTPSTAIEPWGPQSRTVAMGIRRNKFLKQRRPQGRELQAVAIPKTITRLPS